MRNIKVSQRELELLNKCGCTLNNVYVECSEKQAESIINNISNYFANKGLQHNGEPNELGIELENLLDKFCKE